MNTSTLNPDEIIIFETGKHPIVFFKSVVLIALWIFFCTLNTDVIPNFFNTSLNWFNILFGILAGLYALNTFLNYYYSRYILTNQRFIIYNGYGILSRENVSFPRTSLLILDVNQPLLGRLLNYGNVSISMMNKPYGYNYVANPKALYEHFIR